MYKRSTLFIDKVDNFVVSNSETYSQPEVEVREKSVQYQHTFLVKNVSNSKASIFIEKSFVKSEQKINHVNCESSLDDEFLQPQQQALVSCTIIVKKMNSFKNDEIVFLTIPTSSGKIIAEKLIRAGDFN